MFLSRVYYMHMYLCRREPRSRVRAGRPLQNLLIAEPCAPGGSRRAPQRRSPGRTAGDYLGDYMIVDHDSLSSGPTWPRISVRDEMLAAKSDDGAAVGRPL